MSAVDVLGWESGVLSTSAVDALGWESLSVVEGVLNRFGRRNQNLLNPEQEVEGPPLPCPSPC